MNIRFKGILYKHMYKGIEFHSYNVKILLFELPVCRLATTSENPNMILVISKASTQFKSLLFRYKSVIVFEGLAYIATWVLLLWGRGLAAMQVRHVDVDRSVVLTNAGKFGHSDMIMTCISYIVIK